MAKSFILSDERVNGYGFWVKTSGIDLSQFKQNPLMLWMHSRVWKGTKDEVLPIGHWENIRVEGSQLLADPVFDEKDEFALTIKSKVDDGHLRMASIQFDRVITSEDPKDLKPGQTRMTVLKCKLIEASIVDIGGNDGALGLCADPNLLDNGKPVMLSNNETCPVRLLSQFTNKTNKKMDKIAVKLGLVATASEAEILSALDVLLEKGSRTDTLSKRLEDIDKEREQAESAEAVKLVDAAILSGKLKAEGKDAALANFKKDFANAKLMLESIPAKPDIRSQLNGGASSSSDYDKWSKMSFRELDKLNVLPQLKASYPELYKLKFKEQYGCGPKNV